MELKDIQAKVWAVKPKDMSLEALLEADRRAQDSCTQLVRSAYELSEYNMSGSATNYTEVCDEAFALKIKLAEVLLDQARLYRSLTWVLDEELAKRLETIDN